jgi:hypothetical protein
VSARTPTPTAAEALAALRLPPGATITALQRAPGGWWIAWRQRDGDVNGTKIRDGHARRRGGRR